VPALPIDPKLDLSRLTRDPELQRAYIADPLYQTRVTPRIAAELLRAVTDTRERAPDFRVPLFILHGTADTFTSPAASRQFWERAGAADKTYKTYDGAYHNLFVETNREEIYDDIAAWIGART
jgi:alpha-beta hydrolase superfamily lysophospholipase